MTNLRHRLRSANKRCNNPRERHNGDGTVTVDSASWIATRELVQMVPEIDNALWELEELRKEQAKWATVKREVMEWRRYGGERLSGFSGPCWKSCQKARSRAILSMPWLHSAGFTRRLGLAPSPNDPPPLASACWTGVVSDGGVSGGRRVLTRLSPHPRAQVAHGSDAPTEEEAAARMRAGVGRAGGADSGRRYVVGVAAANPASADQSDAFRSALRWPPQPAQAERRYVRCLPCRLTLPQRGLMRKGGCGSGLVAMNDMVIEIRAAEGGDDAKLFAHDLARAYIRFLESKGWKHCADLFPGGAVIETEATRGLENEAGGHRIQRVPPTEKRGRVHTSTVTVSVLSADDAERAQPGFSIRWFSGTGKGGQHRNKHQNCCEVTHLQSGLRRAGTSSRSRITNLRDAMAALQADLEGMARHGAHARRNDTRRAQIGSGMRGDKRRTYRFQEDAVTDHVTGKRARASSVMRGGFDLLW